MLNIIYGDVKNSIYNTNVYFKNSYEPEWLDAELAKKMIKDIDDSEVLSGECINSPVLGQIPPERLKMKLHSVKLMESTFHSMQATATAVTETYGISAMKIWNWKILHRLQIMTICLF